MKTLKNSAVLVMYISNHSDSIKRMPDIYGDYLLQIYEIIICFPHLTMYEAIVRIMILGNHLLCFSGLIEWG